MKKSGRPERQKEIIGHISFDIYHLAISFTPAFAVADMESF